MESKYTLYPSVKNNQFINLEEIIRSKNPKLLKVLPGFLIKYLKKIIHQNDLNQFLTKHGNKVEFDFIEAIVNDFNLKPNVVGKENIPVNGRYIIAANHPIGGPEAILLMHVISEYRKDLKFLVNDILMNIRNLEPLFLPVNKHGSYSKSAAQKLHEAYSSNCLMLTFPYGLVSRRKKGNVQDLDWKKSFISKAKQYERDVVPVHISGKNSNFFYNLANFRKTIGIKANLEMLYLVNETYKHKNETITYHFGKPIPFKTFSKDKTDKEWAEMMRNHLYSLPENIDKLFI
jgi:putative hemolysin